MRWRAREVSACSTKARPNEPVPPVISTDLPSRIEVDTVDARDGGVMDGLRGRGEARRRRDWRRPAAARGRRGAARVGGGGGRRGVGRQRRGGGVGGGGPGARAADLVGTAPRAPGD